jgi:hypothetical protein
MYPDHTVFSRVDPSCTQLATTGYWNPEYEMRNNFDREGRLQVSIKLIFDKLTWTAFWKNFSVWLSKCYAK